MTVMRRSRGHHWRGLLLSAGMGFALVLGAPRGTTAQSVSVVTADSQAASASWIPSFDAFRDNVLDIGQGPLPQTARERRLVVGTAGLLIAMIATLDGPAYEHVSPRSGEIRSYGMSRAAGSLALPGEWYGRRHADGFAVRTVGGLAASGVILRRPVLTRTSIHTLESILYTDAIVGLLKSVVNRNRPYVGPEPNPFAGGPGRFSPAHTKLAMPSGHAGRVFSIATVLAHAADRWYMSAPLYAGATSVSIERVRSGHHWLSDVVVGSAVGYFVGRSVVNRPSADRTRARFIPVLSDGAVGLAVRL